MQRRGSGWVPDPVDLRDYATESEAIRGIPGIDKFKPLLRKDAEAPAKVDLRSGFPPVFDQMQIEACTANAAAGLIVYLQNKIRGYYTAPARLFLYKVTRNFLHTSLDQGAYNRTTMGALVQIGAPPEEFWPYNPASVNVEPSSFAYALATDYKALKYVRFDPAGSDPADTLVDVKRSLAGGLPVMFGFYLFSSVASAQSTGKIPVPLPGETMIGGHAVVAAGYDDDAVVVQTTTGSKPSKGAFLIRNSWGATWGESGYGWLPYDYLLEGLASDWWALISQEIVDGAAFQA